MACKNLCIHYAGAVDYIKGYRDPDKVQCRVCEVEYYLEGFVCPCCGYHVRKKPRKKWFLRSS